MVKNKIPKGVQNEEGLKAVSLGTEDRRGPTQYDCAVGGRHLGDLAVTESGGLLGRLLTEVARTQ